MWRQLLAHGFVQPEMMAHVNEIRFLRSDALGCLQRLFQCLVRVVRLDAERIDKEQFEAV